MACYIKRWLVCCIFQQQRFMNDVRFYVPQRRSHSVPQSHTYLMLFIIFVLILMIRVELFHPGKPTTKHTWKKGFCTGKILSFVFLWGQSKSAIEWHACGSTHKKCISAGKHSQIDCKNNSWTLIDREGPVPFTHNTGVLFFSISLLQCSDMKMSVKGLLSQPFRTSHTEWWEIVV